MRQKPVDLSLAAGWPVVLAVMHAAVLVACDGEAVYSPATNARDSAGVEIVDNAVPRWTGAEAWTVPGPPILDLGAAADTTPALMFSRIVNALSREDGSLVIADGATREIRFFDPAGKVTAIRGGRGQGPGEYERIRAVFRGPRDSLFVLDQNRRITVLRDTGVVVRTFESAGMEPLGIFADGSVLGLGGGPGFAPPAVRPRIKTDSLIIRRAEQEADSAEEFGRFPVRVVTMPGVWVQAFGPTGHGVVHGNEYYHGFSANYQVNVYDRRGKLVRSIRRAWTPRPVTAEDMNALRAAQVAPAGRPLPPAERALWERFGREVVPAEIFPAHMGFLVDHDGNLWVQNTRPEDGRGFENPWIVGAPSTWSVFARNGAWLGDVAMPAGMRVTEITDDRLVGIWRDPDNVEHVRTYRINKPSRTDEAR